MKRPLIAVTLAIPLVFLIASTWVHNPAVAEPNPVPQKKTVQSLRVQLLSTMLAGNPGGGIGEWGFAAIVEVDGQRILFDTGARPDTVLKNAKELGVDLATVKDVILSHNHSDHTNGLMTLRREFAKANPAALSRAHVGKGIFWNRPVNASAGAGDSNVMVKIKPEYEATGGTFVEYSEPKELLPGLWLTGPVPRTYPEKNWSGAGRMKTPDGLVEDTLPEDISLVAVTDKGLVVISGCGHSGIINTLEHARKAIKPAPVYAALGGFHLFNLDDEKLGWTAGKLREFGLRHFLGAHCTGIEAVYRIRQQAGLDRQSCAVGAVGSSFSLEKGIDALSLAR
ncbi:MAG: MBL fold metallo-hydrolase [Acidobacteriota bacterium]|nr:MBL fold metallo-hydrolase [Acidobacteriota bacterium]